MTPEPAHLPPMPVELENAMYEAMMDAVGQALAFRAVEASWGVLVGWFRDALTEHALEEVSDA